MRREAAVEREVEYSRHHQRDDGEKQQRRRVGCRRAMELLRPPPEAADEEREAEHEQQVPDDAAGDRRLDERHVTVAEGNERDDQLRGVAERRVQEPAKRGTRSQRELLRAETDEAGERDERERGGEEYPRRLGVHRVERPRNRGRDDEEVQAVVDERAQHRLRNSTG